MVLTSIQVDVIAADTSGDTNFQVLSLAGNERVGGVYFGVNGHHVLSQRGSWSGKQDGMEW